MRTCVMPGTPVLMMLEIQAVDQGWLAKQERGLLPVHNRGNNPIECGSIGSGLVACKVPGGMGIVGHAHRFLNICVDVVV